MPFEKTKRFRNPKGYLGTYPYPKHIDIQDRNQAIRELLTRPNTKNLPLKKRLLFSVGSHLLHLLVRWIYRLSRQEFSIAAETQALIDDPKGQFIIAIWHNRLFYGVYSLRYKIAQHGHDVLAIISESDDAEFIARCTEYCGAYAARGSSTRGGKKALKTILKYTKTHFHPLITPDGPVGPVYEAKEGLAAIAKITGLPIVPIAYNTKSKWVFNSWDKFMIPKPFAKVFLDYAAPITITSDLSTQQAKDLIQQKMIEQIQSLENKIK